MSDSGSWSDVAGTVVATAALAVASSQAVLLRRQVRRDEVTLTQELLATWNDVADSWRVCMAAEGVGDDFYAPSLTVEERAHIARIGRDPVETVRMFGDEQIWLSDHARHLVTALGRIADLVLSGRASVPLAYLVSGHELTRRSRLLRSMLFNQHDIWMSVDTRTTQEGTRERIMALVDLMWAEAVRRGDLATGTVRAAAEAKRGGTGALCRRRVRSLSLATGGSRKVARQLSASLRIAEQEPPDEWPRWLIPREGMASSQYEESGGLGMRVLKRSLASVITKPACL